MIPKAMAARIKRAQDAVKDKRRAIVYKEREQGKFSEQEATLYERLLSGGLSEQVYSLKIDSISRKRKQELERGPERYAELHALEVQLAALEVEVLRQVSTMRTSKGRVRWPKPLSAFEVTAGEYIAELEEIDRTSLEAHDRMIAQLTEQDEEARLAMESAMTNLAESLVKAVKRCAMTKEAALAFIREL